MTYDRQHLDMSFIFDVTASEEMAVTSIKWSSIAGWTGAVAAQAEIAPFFGGAYLDAMETLMNNANLFWGNYSTLTAVKLAAIGTDGHYLSEPTIYEDPTPVTGASTTTIPQSTVVASLRSGSTFGGANYGRMYLPHTRLGLVTGTAQSNVATTDIVVAAFKVFVNSCMDDLNEQATATLFPMIMSNKTGNASKAVTSLAVGTVTDTQRRRRNRLQETYSFATLA